MLINRKSVALGGLALTAAEQFNAASLARQTMSARFTGRFWRELYAECNIGLAIYPEELVEKDNWLQLIFTAMEQLE